MAGAVGVVGVGLADAVGVVGLVGVVGVVGLAVRSVWWVRPVCFRSKSSPLIQSKPVIIALQRGEAQAVDEVAVSLLSLISQSPCCRPSCKAKLTNQPSPLTSFDLCGPNGII